VPLVIVGGRAAVRELSVDRRPAAQNTRVRSGGGFSAGLLCEMTSVVTFNWFQV